MAGRLAPIISRDWQFQVIFLMVQSADAIVPCVMQTNAHMRLPNYIVGELQTPTVLRHIIPKHFEECRVRVTSTPKDLVAVMDTLRRMALTSVWRTFCGLDGQVIPATRFVQSMAFKRARDAAIDALDVIVG